MVVINGISDIASLLEALKGAYGSTRLPNGLNVIYQGQFVHFNGIFSGNSDAIQIPSLPVRVAVIFSGDMESCCSIAEPSAGFVKVPAKMKGKRFSVFASCILNN